ncbi:MAG: IclR family transcriptional regulator [Desulfarculaceae bacterium]|nr:IclR family transcriptional regulator [Desulfarculaceae bacterium]MCF8074497.1 IclR family transcriptional regulator [Desulfarculaceae bacterium]MCF8103596.1 IclR family transcriptional regulator [Desulfarculaceae bacterium]MCF8118386.1 IclR family transcriptional regulator [Desulfarculaceae bacterium]
MKQDEKSSSKKSASSSQRGAQTIHRAIGLLRMVVNNNERGMSLAQLAREADLHTATVRRALGALASEGLLSYNPITKRYHLGVELYHFGAAAHQFQIRDRYRHILERVALITEDTVFLVIRSGYDALVVDRVEGSFPIRTLTHEVGQRSPLGIGAGSTVLLATLPEKECGAVIQANQRRYGRYKNFTADDVWESVRRCQELGYSETGGVFIPEAVALGRPVRDESGRVEAAISVAAIAQRMDAERRAWVAKVIAEEIATGRSAEEPRSPGAPLVGEDGV